MDLHTAQHIVKKALMGDLARNRTVILVTHHITLCLPIAAYLVELSSGSVLRQGSASELREHGELERLVEAEDTTEEDQTESSSSDTHVENEADLSATVPKPDTKPQEISGKLVDDEFRAEGRVSLRTYWTYIRAAGIISWILTFALMVLIRCINVAFQVSQYECLGRMARAYRVVVLPRAVGRSIRGP